jgi:hypothetical protein
VAKRHPDLLFDPDTDPDPDPDFIRFLCLFLSANGANLGAAKPYRAFACSALYG